MIVISLKTLSGVNDGSIKHLMLTDTVTWRGRVWKIESDSEIAWGAQIVFDISFPDDTCIETEDERHTLTKIVLSGSELEGILKRVWNSLESWGISTDELQNSVQVDSQHYKNRFKTIPQSLPISNNEIPPTNDSAETQSVTARGRTWIPSKCGADLDNKLNKFYEDNLMEDLSRDSSMERIATHVDKCLDHIAKLQNHLAECGRGKRGKCRKRAIVLQIEAHQGLFQQVVNKS